MTEVEKMRNGLLADMSSPELQVRFEHAIERRTEKEYAYPVTIGEDCWIGGGAILCPGVTIGDRCIIGAGSVVTKDIPSDSIAVGNPAKVIRKNEAKK